MKIPTGRVVIVWDDGYKTNVGKLELRPNDDGWMDKPIPHFNRRMGWALIIQGIRMLVRGDGE